MSAAKMTPAKAAKLANLQEMQKFGVKSAEQLKSSKYIYYMTAELEAILDKTTLSALMFGIEACYHKYGPAPWFYAELPRDGVKAKYDHYLHASGMATLFPAQPGGAPSSRLEEFVKHKDFVHNVNHVVGGDEQEFERVIKAIMALSSTQFRYIINNVEKLSGDSGVAVPALYYKVVTEFDNEIVFISPTRYLDHPANLPEAQYKLANGLTANRPWTVRPEHREAYAVLEAEWEAKRVKKQQEEDALYAKLGEPERNEPEALERLMAAAALNKPPAV